MNLIMINNRILNLDHVMEIHFTENTITIEKVVSRTVYNLGEKNIGNNLSAESFQRLRQNLETKCHFIIYGQEEKKQIDYKHTDVQYSSKSKTLVKSEDFQKPPASILNRAGAFDDEVLKKDPEVVKKSRKKKEKKDG